MGGKEKVKKIFSQETIQNDTSHGVQFEKDMGALFLTIFNGGNTLNDKNYTIKQKDDGIKICIPKNVTAQDKAYASKNANKFVARSAVITYNQGKVSYQHSEKLARDIQEGIYGYAKGVAVNAGLQTMHAMIPKTHHKVGEGKYEGFLKGVDMKVDINNKGSNIDAILSDTEFPSDWKQAIQYLSEATFTVKNYQAKTNIKIDDTNAVRALFGVLDSTKKSEFKKYKVQSSAFMHAFNLCFLVETGQNKKKNIFKEDERYTSAERKERAEGVSTHVYHMRFIYELTGAGQKDKDLKDLAEADYLLYNQHNTNKIYVVSSGNIISNMFNHISDYYSFGRLNPFKGTMHVTLDLLDRNLGQGKYKSYYNKVRI